MICATSCNDRTNFDEYPPDTLLSKNEQDSIVNSFICDFNKFKFDPETLKSLRDWYKLRYYINKNGKNYFLISYKGSGFSNLIICIGGEIKIQPRDTTFDIQFISEVPHHFTEDSVKTIFREMLNK